MNLLPNMAIFTVYLGIIPRFMMGMQAEQQSHYKGVVS
ncbi:hypothetical protein CLOBOL_05122 [Enterocloster bolteae ATCC BAA-613]|uniref:Uncharacterized protein n=1 Tax=Enterocloster bolteae (strain ATCC BAA-613 / DSM 15670 / CCUG 46953 / JCM 12243 / WAL 16351) TaxID=411902 RepID=A8RYH0_ENTBW|nr:hypothetical protein CLOBOL_05122 [Enterocloster bolteae ATCC BAA-613]